MRDADKTILHLCADIGSDTMPYKMAGYRMVYIGKNYGVERFFANSWQSSHKFYGVVANPVCTEFSIATGFHKHGDYAKGMFLVNHCLRIIDEIGKENLSFWVIENPASGHLKDFLGKPTHVYEPWWYGDPWTKKTALWGKFNMPQRKYYRWEDVPKNPKLYVRPTRNKPSMAFLHKSAKRFIRGFKDFHVEDDMSFRSLCPQGFAMEFFAVNR
jgi:hypothetical protein